MALIAKVLVFISVFIIFIATAASATEKSENPIGASGGPYYYIQGMVYDPSQAMAPYASITVMNTTFQNNTHTFKSDKKGFYLYTNLENGQYKITAVIADGKYKGKTKSYIVNIHNNTVFDIHVL